MSQENKNKKNILTQPMTMLQTAGKKEEFFERLMNTTCESCNEELDNTNGSRVAYSCCQRRFYGHCFVYIIGVGLNDDEIGCCPSCLKKDAEVFIIENGNSKKDSR